MPCYYDVVRETTTNGSANTRSPHLLFLTGANIRAKIVGLYGSCQSGTAGGATLFGETASTAGSGGTTYTAGPRNALYPAATTVVTTDATTITTGTTLKSRCFAGLAQTGGMGGWVALEPDHAILLRPSGGANGNFEVASKANGTSITVRAQVEFSEE